MASLLETLLAELATKTASPKVLLMAEMMKEFTINLAGLVAFASAEKDVKGLTFKLADKYTDLMTNRKHLDAGNFKVVVRENLKATLKRALEDLNG